MQESNPQLLSILDTEGRVCRYSSAAIEYIGHMIRGPEDLNSAVWVGKIEIRVLRELKKI